MHNKSHPIRFLRMPALRERRGDSAKATVYRHVKLGLLPPPVKLGPNTAAWPEHEIEAIDAARIAGADECAIRELVKSIVAKRQAGAA